MPNIKLLAHVSDLEFWHKNLSQASKEGVLLKHLLPVYENHPLNNGYEIRGLQILFDGQNEPDDLIAEALEWNNTNREEMLRYMGTYISGISPHPHSINMQMLSVLTSALHDDFHPMAPRLLFNMLDHRAQKHNMAFTTTIEAIDACNIKTNPHEYLICGVLVEKKNP